MKYTIELTNKQKAQMDCIIDIVHRYVGFNPKLEPIKATNVEDTSEYQIGYKVGFEDGKKQAIEEIPELANKENKIYNDGYNKGYNSAINDYNMMIQWLHDCTDNFKEFMNKKYGYDIMYLTNPHVDEGVMLYDLICDHDIAEVISEFKKWQEEKKKAEEVKAEEDIRVGDVIYSDLQKITAIITRDNGMSFECIDTDGFGFSKLKDRLDEEWVKVGHTDELSQLFDKLKAER